MMVWMLFDLAASLFRNKPSLFKPQLAIEHKTLPFKTNSKRFDYPDKNKFEETKRNEDDTNLSKPETTCTKYINDDVNIGAVNVWSKPTFPRVRVAKVQNNLKVQELEQIKINGYLYSKIKTPSTIGWLISDWLKD